MIPDGTDQIYRIEVNLTGSAADDVYINDLYTEIALVRHWVTLGSNETLDVTPLAYTDNCTVSCTIPVTNFTTTTGIFSPHAYAYSATFSPKYLQ